MLVPRWLLVEVATGMSLMYTVFYALVCLAARRQRERLDHEHLWHTHEETKSTPGAVLLVRMDRGKLPQDP